MNGRFRQPFRPAVQLLVLTGSGFAGGLLMPQLYVAAHKLDLFVGLMDFIHAPAVFIAETLHHVLHVMDDFIRSFSVVERPKVPSPPNGLEVDFGVLQCLSSGMVIEWTLLGVLTGMVWNISRLRWSAKSPPAFPTPVAHCQLFRSSTRFFLLTGSGFAFGLLMTHLDLAARHVNSCAGLMDVIHAPASFIAATIASVFNHSSFGPPKYQSVGIVVEWTVLGALAGLFWTMRRLHGHAKRKCFKKWAAEE